MPRLLARAPLTRQAGRAQGFERQGAPAHCACVDLALRDLHAPTQRERG